MYTKRIRVPNNSKIINIPMINLGLFKDEFGIPKKNIFIKRPY